MEYAFYFAALLVMAVPLGSYIGKVMNGEKNICSKIFTPCENAVYKLLHIKKDEDMSWKRYALSVAIFSAFGFVILFLLQLLQGILPGNPQGVPGMGWDLSFNNAISFMTNTNWQSYAGESQMSFLTQALGLTVQNFLSAATGIAVLFALIRGFVRVKAEGLGSFWVDITRIVIYVLIPLNIVISLCLVGSGVVQSFEPDRRVSLVEPIAVDQQGQIIAHAQIDVIKNTVHVNGVLVDGAVIITEQLVPLGPAASQIAIKQSGTNGGGFYGANAAHPLENPNPFTNFIELIAILLIPASLCFAFGRSVKNNKQGVALFVAMAICLVVALGVIVASECIAPAQLTQHGVVSAALGNIEGKEMRFGVASSSIWTAFTTAASNGSVNSMLDSYTPMGGMAAMVLIQLGEVIFGGAGSGLYGMLAFAILTVFIAGLMVGRTPEFLGKKIEPMEMKCAVLVCLATPIAILTGSGIAALIPSVANSVTATGAHGFSQLLYAFSSAGGNNGSAFGGLKSDTLFLNISLGLCMLFARFLPIVGTLAISGSLAAKKKIATTAGTLSTTNAMFVFLLIFVVLLIGALSFFPALALGPIGEFFAVAH